MGQQSHNFETLTDAVAEVDLSGGVLRFDPAKLRPEDLKDLTVQAEDSTGQRRSLRTEVHETTLVFESPSGPNPLMKFDVYVGTEPVLELPELFFATDKAFEDRFKSRSARPDDSQLDFFIAAQLFEHFRGKMGYRVSCAVICAYKAAELGDPDKQEKAEKMLLQSLVLLPQGVVTTSARLNKEHLHVSILCALWHLHLAAGNAKGFVQTLESLRALVEERGFTSFFQLAYNVSLSLRVLALLQLMRGERADSQEISELSREIFQLSVRDSTSNLSHFKEIGYTHGHVLETMRLARRTKTLRESTVEKTLAASFRVKADRHPKAYAAMRATFEQAAQQG
ncbi:hypothetical protein [Nesterenkonia populi]